MTLLYQKGFGDYNPDEVKLYDLFLSEDWSIYGASKPAQTIIDLIEQKFSYIRFNHLESKFEMFVTAYTEQKRIYEYFKAGWEKAVRTFCAESGIGYANDTSSKEVDAETLANELQKRLNVKLTTEDEKKELLLLISNSLGLMKDNPQPGTCKAALRKHSIPYTIKTGYTTRNGKNVRYYMIVLYDGQSEEE